MTQKLTYTTLAIFVILSIPYFLQAPWTASDYVVAGSLLFGTAALLMVASNSIKDQQQKRVAFAAVIIGALYIWAELAVGIFTTLGS